MADRHKHAPVSVRLSDDERAWLAEHAAATGDSVHAIIRQALAEYYARVTGTENPAALAP